MRRALILVLLVCTSPFAVSEEPHILADAGIAMCDYPSSENVSEWVSSPAGFSAAVGLQASITGTSPQRHCVTSWKLHVRGQDHKERIFTVAEHDDVPEDTAWHQEKSFEIIAWSKDGRLLLTSQIAAEGDWDVTIPVVFDYTAGKIWRVELYPLFKPLIAPDCLVVYRAIGFTPEGEVLIDPESTDDDREDGTEPCFPISHWTLDFKKRKITRMPENRKGQ